MTSVELVQYVKDKADIVAVIGHYLKLTKKGADYVAICPFHDDTKPSLSISPTKKIFKCFVCGTGGNCITFVQKYEHVSFMQAVKKVCNICNIDVPGLDEVVKVKPKENQDLLDAINNLTGFYHFSLRQKDGEEARSYLEKRNMNDDVINHFKIGYAPLDNTRSIKVLRERFNCSVETLEKAGILANSGSGFYDRYGDRIMFPLENTKGDIVGFSGRIYKDSDKGESKYVNSPETPIFQKSTILYNFRNAKDSVRKDGYLYVLEGFMDVIACYKAGINSAVALMGTALTEAHIALFKELGVEIRLCLDSDNAGQNAMYSTLKLFGKAKLKYKIVRKFTGAKDADEYLNAFGTDGLIDALNSLAEPIEFEAKYLVDNGKLNTLEAKDDYLQTRLIAFSRYKQLVRKDLISRLADILSINKDDLESMVDRANTFKPDDLIEDKEVKKSYASKDSLSNISTETINQNAIYDSCLKYSLSKLKDKNIEKYLNAIISKESCLIAKMAKNKDAYMEFENSQSMFISPYLNKIQNALADAYQKTGKETLDLEDYQNIIDMFEVSNDEDKDLVILIMEIMKKCKDKPYNPEYASDFRKLISDYNMVQKIYLDLIKGDTAKIDNTMRTARLAKQKARTKKN